MANISVMDASTGQITVQDTTNVTVTQVQGLTMLTTQPAEFSQIIMVPAANGMVKAASLSNDATIANASKKANFAALSTMAALAVTDSATTSPTNAPTDAVTNYNTVTTLLGLLVSAVNDANTKQNAIGTNANAIAANVNYLKTAVDGILTYLGLVPTSFNNLRAAGAA